jgi:outer membrane PBP1 activator LpoA protein
LRTTLQRADQSYWADRTEEQMLAISGWVALKEGAQDQALQFMRRAADNEDGSRKHVAMENRLYPFRELLAELLLEMGQPAAALNEFETAALMRVQLSRAFNTRTYLTLIKCAKITDMKMRALVGKSPFNSA